MAKNAIAGLLNQFTMWNRLLRSWSCLAVQERTAAAALAQALFPVPFAIEETEYHLLWALLQPLWWQKRMTAFNKQFRVTVITRIENDVPVRYYQANVSWAAPLRACLLTAECANPEPCRLRNFYNHEP